MRALRCWLGVHNLTDRNWGYGFGQLDLFCTRCEERVLSIAIGRLAPLADEEYRERKKQG